MVRLILNKIDNPKQHLEVKINLHETQTTDKWISLLKKALMSNAPIKKHVSMHGWIMDQTRTLKHIVDEAHYRVNKINEYNFLKRAWELKQKTITKDFIIDLDLSVDNLIQDKTFNFDVINELHDKFVQLEGAKTLDNLVNVSPYFELAPKETMPSPRFDFESAAWMMEQLIKIVYISVKLLIISDFMISLIL